jgi:sec-independent protein translocase protein TatA
VPGLGIRELLFVLLVVAFFYGAKRLPQIARGLGSGIRNFKGSLRAGHEDDSGDVDDRDA